VSAPRWAIALLRRIAPRERVDDVLGDLEEGHRRRIARRGRLTAGLLTGLEALDLGAALLRERLRARSVFSWLDFKLGLRMLVRYPGLTIVGGVAIAFAIWMGAVVFELTSQVFDPRIPLPEGDRLVAVRLYDVQTRLVERRALRDFALWRAESTALTQWGAFRSSERNLIVDGSAGEAVAFAEMSVSGFALAGAPPHLGRGLTEADELPGAPDVVVLGYDAWRTRLAADPNAIGRTVQLGATRATVVGVMPPGFKFPIAHDAWMALRFDPLAQEWREGPGVQLFARLAPGRTLAEARTELGALVARAAAAQPRTHARLAAEVMPYAHEVLELPPQFERGVAGIVFGSRALLFGLLGVICGNVALLIFARAAARHDELVVRSALGAGRTRIVTQLFTEALVLGALGAALGLAAARYGLGLALTFLEFRRLPFWFNADLSPATILFAALLTVVGAVLAGALPALRITRDLGSQLRGASAGGGGLRFGGIWTAVIVAQVALTIFLPSIWFYVRRDREQIRVVDDAVAGERFLTARLEMDRDPPAGAPADTSRAAFLARFHSARTELERRVQLESSVLDVTFADRLPGMYHSWNQIEVDAGGLPPNDPRGHRMGLARVDPDYFDVMGLPVLAGRGFGAGDLDPAARTVIVNRSFVDSVMGGKSPIGRRLRFIASEAAREPVSDGPWHEIVGVVEDGGTLSGYGVEGIYRASSVEELYPAYVAVRLRGDPLGFAPRLESLVAAVDPTLRARNVIRLDDTVGNEVRFYTLWLRLCLGVTGLALLLSLAGIYAVMSFTVSRRTREIGVRVALGGKPAGVLLSILARPRAQVTTGIALGMALVVCVVSGVSGWRMSPVQVAAMAGYALVMAAVCSLACVVPTRRALRVEPTEALRADG
jgi:putative ABC transport system permease protein